MLVDHDVELALKLGLLLAVGERDTGRDARHVLDDHEAERVGGIVEQVRLDLDLLGVAVLSASLIRPFKHQSHIPRVKSHFHSRACEQR